MITVFRNTLFFYLGLGLLFLNLFGCNAFTVYGPIYDFEHTGTDMVSTQLKLTFASSSNPGLSLSEAMQNQLTAKRIFHRSDVKKFFEENNTVCSSDDDLMVCQGERSWRVIWPKIRPNIWGGKEIDRVEQVKAKINFIINKENSINTTLNYVQVVNNQKGL